MKNWSVNILVLILLVLTFLLGFNYLKKPFADRFLQKEDPVPEISSDELTPTINPIPALWNSLSAKEKVLQVIAMPYLIENKNQAVMDKQIAWLKNNPVGLITFFGQEITLPEAKKNIDAIFDQAKTQKFSPLLAVDHEGGKVQRFNGEGFIQLPSFREICQNQEASQAAEIYQSSARQLSDLGINIIFAPVVDLAETGTDLADRSCSNDLNTTADFAVTSIVAYGKSGIMSVIKHFPGMGLAKKDVHFSSETVELRSKDADVFKTILDEIPNIGVMTAHLKLEGLLDKPCSLSEQCLTVLKENYPAALVFTDALDMAGALEAIDDEMLIKFGEDNKLNESSDTGEAESDSSEIDDVLLEEVTDTEFFFTQEDLQLASAAKVAILAGNDVLVFGKGVDPDQLDKVIEMLVIEYQKDESFAKKLDLAGQKILDLKK